MLIRTVRLKLTRPVGDLYISPDGCKVHKDPFETDASCNPELYTLANVLALNDSSLLKPLDCTLLSPSIDDVNKGLMHVLDDIEKNSNND